MPIILAVSIIHAILGGRDVSLDAPPPSSLHGFQRLRRLSCPNDRLIVRVIDFFASRLSMRSKRYVFVLLSVLATAGCITPSPGPADNDGVFDDRPLGKATFEIMGHSWEADISHCYFSSDGHLQILGHASEGSPVDSINLDVTRGFDDDGQARDAVQFRAEAGDDDYRFELDDSHNALVVDSGAHTISTQTDFLVTHYPSDDFEEPMQTEVGSLELHCDNTTEVPAQGY